MTLSSRTCGRNALPWLGGTILWFLAVSVYGQQPAFPGAEGFGAFASGGRSGIVYHVTNTSNSGSGSFRDAVSAGNRTIVFDVSGTINLLSALTITKSNMTIAGQTAPGDGIALRGNLTSVQFPARNVIVRYIHCRPGDINCTNFQDDAFHFDTAYNSIVDHVSASWSIDEALSVTTSTNITVQWCLIAEPLNNSCHYIDGAGTNCCQTHGYGSLLRYGKAGVTFHHDLYAHNWSRNPRLGDNVHLDFVNNVLYNWQDQSGYNANDASDNPGGYTNFLNYVGNYLIGGPNTSSGTKIGRAFASNVPNPIFCQIFQSGNLIDTNKNGVLDGVDKGWAAFQGTYTQSVARFAFPQVNTDDANAAYVRVLSSVGASLVRDAVDSAVISNVLNQDGAIIDSQTQVGGWPTLNSLPAPLDTDQDGMPDFWEQAMGSDTNNAADRNDLMPDGYTRLEWYLNWLAGPHAIATNSFVDVELQQFTAGLQGATYGVSSPSNGTVALLGDGHTARFSPTNSFTGLASFQFVADGFPASLTGTVSVLVQTSIAPPPTVAFTASPTNGIEPLAVTFTDASSGTPPLSLAWDFGDNITTNTAGGASFGHTYAAGVYTVTLTTSNANGISTLVSNNLVNVITAFQNWQLQYFNCTNCAQAAATADPDGDGQNNLAEFLAGTDPTNNLSGLHIISASRESNAIRITWTTAGGRTNAVQATAGDINGSYQTNFADISTPIVIPGSGDSTTNYLDAGGATNASSGYYRIRLVP
jgi:PKD repeat protein